MSAFAIKRKGTKRSRPFFSDREVACPEAMQEADWQSLQDNVLQHDLQAISSEEQQLLHLRVQLQKIKKIREEHQKKDQQVLLLKERIATLESQRDLQDSQQNELQQILSERISTLEKYVTEKEISERVLLERVVYLEEGNKTVGAREEDLALQLSTERTRSEELRVQLEDSQQRVAALSAHVEHEHSLYTQLQSLFETLRQESSAKDRLSEQIKLQTADREQAARKENEQLAITVQELRSRLRLCEEKTSKEQVLRKEQAKTCENVQSSLQYDNDRLRQENEKLRAQANGCEQALLVHQRDSESQLVTLEAERQRLSERNHQLEKESSSLRDELQSIRKVVVDLTKQLSQVVSLNESSAASNSEMDRLQRRVEDQHRHMAGAFRRAFRSMEGEPLRVPVRALCDIVMWMCWPGAAAVSRTINNNGNADESPGLWEEALRSVARDFSSSALDSQRMRSALLSVSAQLSKEGFGTDLDAKSVCEEFGESTSQISSTIIARVVGGVAELLKQVQQVRHQISQQTVSTSKLLAQLQQSELAREDEKAKFLELKSKMIRENDEALLAVRVSECESAQSDRLRESETNRLRKHAQLEFDQETSVWKERFQKLLDCSQRWALTSLSVTEALHQRTLQCDRLRDAYAWSTGFAHGYEILLNDLKTLARCTRDRSLIDVNVHAVAQQVREQERRHLHLRAVGLTVLAAIRWTRLGQLVHRRRSCIVHIHRQCDLAFETGGERKDDKQIPQSSLEWFRELTSDWNLPPPALLQSSTAEEISQNVVSLFRDKITDSHSYSSASGRQHAKSRSSPRPLHHWAYKSGHSHNNCDDCNELFGQREVNELHRYMVDAFHEIERLSSRNDSLQDTLNKVEEDLALCKDAVALQESWQKNDLSQTLPSIPREENGLDRSFLSDSSRWFDDSMDGRDWSRTIDDSRLAASVDMHSRARVSPEESMSELLNRYSQDRLRTFRSTASVSSKYRVNESKDHELQDIFQDIGKLSKKLESRIRLSRDS